MEINMQIEIINAIGSICVIILTILIALPKPKMLIVNILSAIACILLIITFNYYENGIEVFKYSILLFFALLGIKNNWRIQNGKTNTQ
jgi:hypothetical protein